MKSSTDGAAVVDWSLQRDAFGRLLLVRPPESAQEVQPVRAFPFAAPDQDIALVDGHGHELVWIEHLAALPESVRDHVRAALAERELMPVIEAILSVSAHSTPCSWELRTDRGLTTLRLKSEQDIRRLPGNRLLVADADGLCFLIADPAALDRASRRALDHFL